MGYSTISPPNSKPLGVHGPAVWAADAKMLSMWKQRKGLKRDIMSVTRFARPLCTAGNASDASQCRTGTSCRGSRTDRRIRSRNRTRTPAWHSHALIVPRCVQPFMFLGRRYKPPACAGDAPAHGQDASGKEESRAEAPCKRAGPCNLREPAREGRSIQELDALPFRKRGLSREPSRPLVDQLWHA